MKLQLRVGIHLRNNFFSYFSTYKNKINMYQSLSIFSTLLLTFSLLSSCSGQENTETAVVNQSTVNTNQYQYEFFNEVVFNQDGEFVGLNLLEDRESVKQKLPKEALKDESEDFLYYEWLVDGNQYNLDLFFNTESKLKSIDGYINFYKNKEKDKASADLFYADMEKYFIEKYGKENIENNTEFVGENDLKFVSWYFEDKDVEVGLDDVEVYWYMSAYESLFIEEELEDAK